MGDKKLNRELAKAESVSALSGPQSTLNPMHESIEHPHPNSPGEVHTEIAPFHHVEEVVGVAAATVQAMDLVYLLEEVKRPS